MSKYREIKQIFDIGRTLFFAFYGSFDELTIKNTIELNLDCCKVQYSNPKRYLFSRRFFGFSGGLLLLAHSTRPLYCDEANFEQKRQIELRMVYSSYFIWYKIRSDPVEIESGNWNVYIQRKLDLLFPGCLLPDMNIVSFYMLQLQSCASE